MMSGERILVHGPCLRDLTDFLYFDRVVYPATMAYVRPRTLDPGYVGYPLREPLPDEVRARLSETGLITSAGGMVTVPAASDLVSRLAQGAETFLASMQQRAIAAGAELAKIAFSSLDTPATDADVVRWMRELDANAKALADLVVKHGHRAVAKLHAEDVTWTLRPGWTPVLCLTFHRLPRLQPGPTTLDAMIAFLGDTETRRLRRQLFDWHEGVPSAVAGGDLRLDDIPARIASLLAEYRTWIMASGLSSGTMTAEFLLAFDESFVQGVSALRLPEAQQGEFQLGRRGVSLVGQDLASAGREIAYVSHAKKHFRAFWPG
jgi:hypothetical protein